MKKFISLFLCLLMLAALCACGKDESDQPGSEDGVFSRPQITSPNRPKKTDPEKTTPQATAASQVTTPAAQASHALTKAFTYEELTLYMPEEFEDLTQQISFGIYNFVVGIDEAAVCASRSDSGNLHYLAFTNALVESLDNAGEVTDQGGYATFTYQASGYGMTFQYVVGVFPSGDQMWLVQAYCQVKDAQQWEDILEAIIHSVRIAP